MDWLKNVQSKYKTQAVTGNQPKTGFSGDWLNSALSGQPRPTPQLFTPPAPTTIPTVASKNIPQKIGKAVTGLLPMVKKITTPIAKFAVRTGVEATGLLSETLDFTADFLAGQVEKQLKGKGTFVPLGIGTIQSKTNKKAGEIAAEKWRKFYEEKGGQPTEKAKNFTNNLKQIEFIQPSKEWQKASIKEKFTKRLPETILNIGPGIVSSLGSFALNPAYGFVVSAGSTADDIKTIATQNGVSKEKAELLGLGTGLLVGWLDKIVPDELFSPAQKKQLLSGLVKRVVKTGLKEAGTEVAQEDIQLLVESTLRDDLKLNEVAERNAMAGLGGLLGGSGSQGIVSFVNGIRNGDIANLDTSNEVIPDGEYTPQEIRSKVIDTPLEKTPYGKKLILDSITAEEEGRNVVIGETKLPEVENTPVGVTSKETIGIHIAGGKEFASLKGVTQEQFDYLNKETQNLNVGYKPGEDWVDLSQVKNLSKPENGYKEVTIDELRAKSPKIDEIFKNYEKSQPKEVAIATKPVEKPVEATTETSETKNVTVGQESTIPIVKPGTESKPAQLPVGEGKVKESKAYSRIVERYGKEMADLDVEYKRMNIENEVEKAMNYINEKPEEALRTAFGLTPPPDGQTETAISITLADKALEAGNISLWNQLEASRSLRQTRRGQEIVIERGRFNDDSPHQYLRQAIDKRLEILGSKVKSQVVKEFLNKHPEKKTISNKEAASEYVNKQAERLSKEIARERKKIRNAQDIIDILKCK